MTASPRLVISRPSVVLVGDDAATGRLTQSAAIAINPGASLMVRSSDTGSPKKLRRTATSANALALSAQP
jgi:hypothetical protein